MKKYIDNYTGYTVELGDFITRKIQGVYWDAEINKETLPYFLSQGILSEKPQDAYLQGIFSYAKKTVEEFTGRTKLSSQEVYREWERIWETNSQALFSSVLRKIAIDLDEAYYGNISDCSKVYIINSFTGNIDITPSPKVQFFKCFSAFRTKEDAEAARAMMLPLLNKMFSGK